MEKQEININFYEDMFKLKYCPQNKKYDNIPIINIREDKKNTWYLNKV